MSNGKKPKKKTASKKKSWPLVALIATGISGAALYLGYHNFYLSERPWMNVTEVKLTRGEIHQGFNPITVTFTNSGKLVGYLETQWSQPAITASVIPQDADEAGAKATGQTPPPASHEPIFPNDPYVIGCGMSLDKPLVDSVAAGKRRFAVFGEIQYKDNFWPRSLHTTKFCWYYVPGSNGKTFTPCNNGFAHAD